MSERERCAVCDFPLATDADDAVLDKAAAQAGQLLDDVALFSDVLCWSSYTGAHREGGELADGVKHWRARALEAEARVAALEGALRDMLRVRNDNGLTCELPDAKEMRSIARAALSTTPPKPAPRPDAMAELEEARSEIIKLRVKNKFLREKVGYFRDDIESAAAGRDGCPGVFASPGSGSTPEAASLGAEHRPDATEALRVAMEALDGLLSHLGDPMELEDLHGHDFDSVVDYERARSQVMAENHARAALELLRAHVEPTPLETAVLTHTEKETP